jgi:GNAT superfamily N-acetyltransferase
MQPRRRDPVYVRVEHDHDLVIGFLVANEYPRSWTKAMLADCLVVRVFTDNETIGYIWGQWVDTGIMTFHACVTPWFRGRWLTPALLEELEKIAFWVGADQLIASTDDLPKGPKMARLLKRLGFEEDDPTPFETTTIFTKNLWTDHGLPFSESTESQDSARSTETR